MHDCQCSLKTEGGEYLPVTSVLPTESRSVQVCWLDDLPQLEKVPDGLLAAEGIFGKITSPIFIWNSALLL